MKIFLKYTLIAFVVQSLWESFSLATGIGGWFGFVFYMFPYLFVGIITGNTQSTGEGSLPGFVILMLIPIAVYSLLIGLAGYLFSRLNRKLN